MSGIDISIVLPCRNEEKSIGPCIDAITAVMGTPENLAHYSYEIVVADPSSDDSAKIALQKGARIISHDREGYGIACQIGIEGAKGEIIIMADADGTYDFSIIPTMIKQLKQGNDLVLGNRYQGKMQTGSMPFLHKYLGNPVLSFLFRTFFGGKVMDTHSGIRAFRKKTYHQLELKTTGMEFASEMLIKAVKHHCKIIEIPVNYFTRKGVSKLSTFRDGWRHLRFMLLYAPVYLFLLPGLLMLLLGLSGFIALYFGVSVGNILFYEHPLFVMAVMIIIGFQVVLFGLFGKTYAFTHLGEHDPFMERLYSLFSIERSLLYGLLVIILGSSIYIAILNKWVYSHFAGLNEIKNGILGLTLIALGIQTIFSSFMLSILSIKER